MLMSLLVVLMILIVRGIDLYFFLKKVSSVCHRYDWKHVDHNDILLVDMLTDEDYTKTREWSAYNFLFYNGPSPLEMYLSFKSLKIETQYNKEVVKKLKEYETIKHIL
tara:strand:- start:2805 stop:3128 length:324 start_codon:yes stop_codon:yes gene_type:complete